MVLVTHAVVGAALGQLLPGGPILSGIIGFVSHFALDLVPHWDYRLSAVIKGERPGETDRVLSGRPLAIDVGKVLFDVALGALLIWWFLTSPWESSTVIWAGAFGALLPDGLQFLSLKFRPRWLEPLQRFHHLVHSEQDFKTRPLAGIGYQLLLIVATIMLVKIILP